MAYAENIVVTGNGKQASLSQPMTKVARVLANSLLISTMMVATLVFAASSLPALLGFKTMVVTSGSMEPTIRTGDSVVIRPTPPESLALGFKDGFIRIGDVITFKPFGAGGLVTHRVIAVKEMQGDTYFQTQGDANATPDVNLAAGGAVYGKVTMTVPRFGYVLHFTATPLGKVLMILVPILILMWREVRGLFKGRVPRRTEPFEVRKTHHRDVVHPTLNEPFLDEDFLDGVPDEELVAV